jgi:hypothetical protein
MAPLWLKLLDIRLGVNQEDHVISPQGILLLGIMWDGSEGHVQAGIWLSHEGSSMIGTT